MRFRLRYAISKIILAILACFIFPGILSGQDESKAIQFHGSNSLVSQLSTRQGSYSEAPKNYLRNDLQMTLTVNQIPIATSFYLTTDQKDYMQRINTLSFYIDLYELKKNKARIEAAQKANKLDNVKGYRMLRFLSNFSRIEAGRFRPQYGDLTLKGIAASGVNLEYAYKAVYAAFSYGSVKRSTTNDSAYTSYKQKLWFGKLGVGKKRGNHFYLSYLNMSDETSEPVHKDQDTIPTLKPESNQVIGAELRLSFFHDKWTINGEAGGSIFTRDDRMSLNLDSIYHDNANNKITNFLMGIIEPKVSTSTDYAYNVSTKLNLRSTSIMGGYSYIGPGYYTLGNPNLINDRRTIDGRVDQALLRRRIAISAFFKYYRDNLNEWKDEETKSYTYGISMRLSFKNAPYFQVRYAPVHQETDKGSLSISNDLNIISLSIGYKYKVGTSDSYSSLSYLRQKSDYEVSTNDSANNYSNVQTFALNQIFNCKDNISINFNASHTSMENTSYHKNINSFILNGTYLYKQEKWEWRNLLGFKFFQSNGIQDEKKASIFLNTQVILYNMAEIGLNFEQNFYRNYSQDFKNYNEFIVQLEVTFKW